ncbi:hypothetical protein VFPPC_11413 [Pochonia chlamydosporia 170]|uniref:PKD domain-containing protein n=1 Tax=Pochonia chlamydosporia 170 TaxID=1380566 RepID=A0A179EWR3_METCM|nr:hypothetical protein VFPPC_11413 [Pochonia chlamydosporia 170]OAQ57627.1 hypothetical protein VFPPC_11413 [Pochonia chlamydosporia 170]
MEVEKPSKLISRILVSRSTVHLGESFQISVRTAGKKKSSIHVAINGTLGKEQYLQLTGKPGKRKIFVTAFADNKRCESREVVIEAIQRSDCDKFPEIEVSKGHHQNHDVVFRVSNGKEVAPDPGTRYLWDFGRGQKGVSAEPVLTHSFEDSLDPDSPYTTFHVMLTVVGRNETKITAARSFTMWNSYVVDKLRGLLKPKLTYEFRALRDQKMLTAAFTVHNVEDEPLEFDTQNLEYLRDDPEAVNPISRATKVDFVIIAKSANTYDCSILHADLPAGCFGYAVHLTGHTRSKKVVRASAYFEYCDNNRALRVIRDPKAIRVFNDLRNDSCCRRRIDSFTRVEVEEHLRRATNEISLDTIDLVRGVLDQRTLAMNGGRSGVEDFVGRECVPDEEPPVDGIVCQLTEEWAWVVVPGRIINAQKGDTILSPGGNSAIGGLLKQVTPPQMYSHNGIMTQNFYTIRHSTGSTAWLKDHLAGSFLGNKGTDGIEPDALKYLWPGTVDQSVEEAFNGSRFPDPEGRTDEYGQIKTYRIADFSAEPSINANAEFIDPLVVKPHPYDEALHPEVRTILHKVAEAAKSIRGHYRFFCYTDGHISDPAFGAAYRAPDRGPTWWASNTLPTVCASFVWAAMRAVKDPQVRLEGRNTFTVPGDLEDSDIQSGAQVDTQTVDGLYHYTAEERTTAANWLYKYFYDLAEANFPDWIPNWLAGDAPDDVANQVCNTFAFDWSGKDEAGNHAKDSDRWKEPGDGRAVSPNDIKNWDAPTHSDGNSNVFRGVYGHSEKVIYRPARIEWRRINRWVKTKAKSFAKGDVAYRGNAVAGALVKAGGKTTVTQLDGTFKLELPSGSYHIEAGKPISGLYAEGSSDATLLEGQTVDVRILLSDPPELFRQVVLRGTMHLKDEENWPDSNEYATRVMSPRFINIGPYGTHAELGWNEGMGGEVRAELYLNLDWIPGSSITVTWTLKLFEGTSEATDDLDGELSGSLSVAKDATQELPVKVKNTDEGDDDYVDLRLFISNNRAP